MGTLTNMVYPTDRVDTIMATLTHLVYLTKRVGTIMGYIDQQGVHICIYIYIPYRREPILLPRTTTLGCCTQPMLLCVYIATVSRSLDAMAYC